MVSYKIKIGIAPCRRNMPSNFRRKGGIWSKEAALDMKNIVIPYIKEHFSNEHVEFVDLEWLSEDGMMYEYEQAAAIAERFNAEKIDALFIANMNFGCEEVAAKAASLCKVPTLIWAPQEVEFGITEDKNLWDDTYGGRLLDAQCGLFAISKLLQRYHVKFTAIPTCPVDSDIFKQYFDDFAAVTCMIKNFKTMRIMKIGDRSQAFTSMMFNEDELLEKFGIEVFPFSPVAAQQKVLEIEKNTSEEEIMKIVDEFLSYFPGGDPNEELRELPQMKRGAQCYLMWKELFETTGCSAISVDNSYSMAIGGGGSMDIQLAANEGKFVMFESDMLAGIMMVLMSSATFGEKLPFFGEFTANHPTEPNVELIWHTSVYPPKIASHENFEPYSMKGGWGVQTGMEVGKGDYTLARIDAMDGKYAMLIGNYEGVDGPFTRQHYQWGKFKDWHKFELATMYGPYVHHMVEIEGGEEISRRLKEFCRYTGIYADVPDERETPFCDLYYKD